MMSEEQFTAMIRRIEDETVDFKSQPYDFSTDHGRLGFVKDVLCMANTPREASSFIIVGVEKHPDGGVTLHGVGTHPDDAMLQTQFTGRVYPVPEFRYFPIQYSGKQFGIIEIPVTAVGPCAPLRDFNSLLRQWQIYFRRGSVNDVANPEDSARILAWFGKIPVPRFAYEDGGPLWDRFVAELDGLDPGHHYLLVLSPARQESEPLLSSLGRVPWTAVIDFDPESDSIGVLAACKVDLEARRSLHIATTLDRSVFNLRGATYWFFARGLVGREGTVETGPWQVWQRAYGGAVSEYIRRLAASTNPTPVTVVCLWYDQSLIRHFQSVLELILGSFGESAKIVIVTHDPADLQPVAADVGAVLLPMPLHQVCSGFATLQDELPKGLAGEGVSLPSSSGAPVLLPSSERRWIEEELDLVHLGIGLTPRADRAIGVEFLRGAETSWYDLGLHYDIDRDLTEKTQRQLEIELRNRRTSRVNIYHAPGAGGTTVARRLLWNLHRSYPCAVLRRTSPPDTAERLFRIASLTGHSLLLLVDGAEISERQVDELYDHLRSRHIPVALLQVLRRFTVQSTGLRAFYLSSELSTPEAQRFAHVFAREQPARRADIEALLTASDPRYRSAFYFGLTAFREDFLGLDSYVGSRLGDLTPSQQRILGFIALAHHYAQRPLPAQAFSELLGHPRERPVVFQSIFPQTALDLLVQMERGTWRTAHDLIALEILEQLLWPGSTDRRQWKQNLSAWALEFADLCRGSGSVPSDEMLEVARRVFIYRDNAELLGTERSATRQFSQLLQEIPTKEGRLGVLRKLTESYPEEPHFWAHLGRFYSIDLQTFDEALMCIDRALDLQPSDSVLHHMRGMSLRQRVYKLIQENGRLEQIIELSKQASESFAKARDLNPDDDHGYISEVQLLAKVVDYAGRKHPEGALGYLGSPAADPYLRDCIERAEDLLERVRRNREGQGASPYEEDCRAKLDALYGRHDRALQIWDSLLTRKDVFGPPVRRQIVWTYLARRGRSWDGLPPKEIDRMVALLEQNVLEEPQNDVNLRLWVQAVRRSSHPPTIESVIERISHWRANTHSLEASFYLYIMYALQAVEGSALALDSALRFIEECRGAARFRRNRTKSFEWLGTGVGVRRLVHHSQLGEWNTDRDFWSNTSPLARGQGRIVRIDGPQAGVIEVRGGISAFFVPAKGGYRSGSENRMVTFYLGFSYDGVRAWEVRDT